MDPFIAIYDYVFDFKNTFHRLFFIYYFYERENVMHSKINTGIRHINTLLEIVIVI
jgi:hypothetical protein